MLNGRSTRDEKFDYLDETDAEEKNVGSVIPFEQDAMGIRNDEGKVGGDANTPVFGEDEDADDEDYDELVEAEETDLKNIGIGIPGNLEHSSTERAGSIDEAMDDLEDFSVTDNILPGSAISDEDDDNDELDDDALEENELDDEDLDDDDLEENELDDEDLDDDETVSAGATFNAGYTETVHDAASARIASDEGEGIHVETRGGRPAR
jgi:hypothetical protein